MLLNYWQVYDLHCKQHYLRAQGLISVFPRTWFLGCCFVLYTHPLSQINLDSGLDLNKFSKDTQLFNSAPPADFNPVSKQTELCVDRVWVWIESNKLKLNEENMEAMVMGSR